MSRYFVFLSGLAAALSLLAPARAAQQPGPQPVVGPRLVTLKSGIATLQLPQGFAFVDGPQITNLLKESGEPTSGDEVGAVFPMSESEGDRGVLLISYEANGYVKDDEAGKLDPDGLLKSIREGTAEANKDRKRAGSSEVEVVGWFKKPHYDQTRHVLSWSIIGKDLQSNEQIVNHEAEMLCRYGTLSCTMIASLKISRRAQATLDRLTAGVSFLPGKDYASWQPGDKVSDRTLTDLVLGGAGVAAAVKMGLFAKLGKLILVTLLALKKGIVVIVVGIAAALRRRKGEGDPTA